MNIVIKNQNYRVIDSLNSEIIKTLTGEFTIEEVGQNIVNLFYNKAIIDITAIKNYYDINSVITFLRGFDPTKIVLLLNDSEVINSNSFLGRLVENGIYNFTRNAAGIIYLLDHPNSLDNVIQYINAGVPASSINPLNDSSPIMPALINQTPLQSVQLPLEQNKQKFEKANHNQKIIGVQNLSDHAGSTTLAYMMIKQLKIYYQAKGIEMNKQDFVYFRDSDLSLCTGIDDFKLKLKELVNAEVIIVDLNDFDATEFCDEILYLLDPGSIKLNKLIKKDSNVLSKVRNGKMILNRSAIKNEEIPNFEYETKFKVFFNMPNFDDRKERIQVVDALLYNLGFTKQNPSNMGVFGNIFNKN